jgi:GNAT superfamily N-acetyltransferase
MASTYKIRTFEPKDAPRMEDLQARCIQVCPDTGLLPAGFYFAPGFENGANIYIAEGSKGEHLGQVMIYPYQVSSALEGARVLWMDLRVDPGLINGSEIQDALLLKAIERAQVLQQRLKMPAVLAATYYAQGEASIQYLQARGFRHYETGYTLRRDLSQPIPEMTTPANVDIRPWRMESEKDQIQYIQALESVFHNDAWNLKALQQFMSSDLWSVGTTFTAFSGKQIIGSVMAYYGPDDPGKIGTTEHVFVLPQWRKQGVASWLLKEALLYLKDRGLLEAELQISTDTPRNIEVYQKVGFQVFQEEVSLGFEI